MWPCSTRSESKYPSLAPRTRLGQPRRSEFGPNQANVHVDVPRMRGQTTSRGDLGRLLDLGLTILGGALHAQSAVGLGDLRVGVDRLVVLIELSLVVTEEGLDDGVLDL